METAQEYINYYLNMLRNGEIESAFFGLCESPFDVVPILVETFKTEYNPTVRKEILRVIWQLGSQNVMGAIGKPKVISLLDSALHDSESIVWKEALDGLVALASPESLAVLQRAKSRIFPTPKQSDYFQKWIDEAVGQVQETLNT